MLVFASRFCLLSGLILLLAAGVWFALYGNPAPPQEALVLETSAQDLGPMPVGEHTVEFAIRNRSDQPYHILGAKSV